MDVDAIRERVREAVWPLQGVDSPEYAPRGGYWTNSGERLPEYYLVYFLLVDLLEFDYVGQHEKVAWGIPVDLNGYVLSIEFRKPGLGIVAYDGDEPEVAATEIVRLIKRGLPEATPYFNWRAEEAAKGSEMNVLNRAPDLYDRFTFLLNLYEEKCTEYEANTEDGSIRWGGGNTVDDKGANGREWEQAQWLATSAIESFFSWTEHVFIHLAILQGRCLTAHQVRNLASGEWKDKFKAAFDLSDNEVKQYYDELEQIRVRTRNFVAHGAFGKDGDAFELHSTAGAIPVRLVRGNGRREFRFESEDLKPGRHDRENIELIKDFVSYVRSGALAPAWVYIDRGGTANLVEARDGRYREVMVSVEAMQRYADSWEYLADMYMNFDFPE